MSVLRLCKLFSAVALFGGFLALTLPESALAANKVEDARKYTAMLKSSKSSKDKATALTELGELGRLMKSLVADALPSMVAAMKDSDSSVRAAAATAVGKCDPDSEAVKGLEDLAKNDKDESVKIALLVDGKELKQFDVKSTDEKKPETLEAGAMSGAILETFVVTEILKSWWHRLEEPAAYYCRDKDGREVRVAELTCPRRRNQPVVRKVRVARLIDGSGLRCIARIRAIQRGEFGRGYPPQ